ncbi:hypothetical protein BY458DRAFT_541767 [Sporodiniella umbellata]|nr:hypothetical protein BY458DRAFT_541767 [Sporodiniella umbellata]
MNPTHDAKEWHMSQAPMMNEPGHASSYSPMDHPHYPAYSQGPMHPPISQHPPPPPPPANYLPHNKQEGDPRLPGMMALSQPGTPRPGPHSPTHTKKQANLNAYHPYAAAAAAAAHPVLARKRGRSELFSAELGPFFSSTKPFDNLYAMDRSTLLTVRIQAKMDRGFFLADNDWTCYRRNYFQVSGAFAIQGLNHYYAEQETQSYVQHEGTLCPVLHYSMCISARVSNSDKRIDLVQHTPKRDKGPQTTPHPKPVMPGGNLNMSSVGASQSIVTFERIQFKTATANNGKRRAAQQYYVCLVDLYAEIEGNRRVKVASCQSAPLVVRGRSPGHYSDNAERYEPMADPPEDRFMNPPFPRPPMTPPAAVITDYASPYYSQYPTYPPHQNTQHFHIGLPPTPTHHHHHHHHHPPGYMIPSMSSSDPSSSESSSPDLYQGDFLQEEANKPRPPMLIESHPPPEWHPRSRLNSASTHTSYDTHSYFSNSSQQPTTSFSHSNPPTPYGHPRKYNPTA